MWTYRKTKCIKYPRLVNYVHTCFKRLMFTFGSNSKIINKLRDLFSVESQPQSVVLQR